MIPFLDAEAGWHQLSYRCTNNTHLRISDSLQVMVCTMQGHSVKIDSVTNIFPGINSLPKWVHMSRNRPESHVDPQ